MSAATSNAPAPSNADRLAATREVGDIDRRLDELRGQRKAVVKRWKLIGISARTLAVAKRDAGLEAEEIMAEIRERVLFNALRGTMDLARYGKTGDFLDDLDTHLPEDAREEDQLWLTTDQGYRAGKDGVAIDDCPYTTGSERSALWMRAWHDGQAAAVMAMAPGSTMADASRARPERTEETLAAFDAVADVARTAAEMTNVVQIDAAGGRLTPGEPSPKGGTTKKGGKGKGKGGRTSKGGRKLQTAPNGEAQDVPLPLPGVETKRRPGRPQGSGNKPAAAKAANGEHPEPLALSAPRKRGRPSKAEVAARAAVATDAGRGDLVEA